MQDRVPNATDSVITRLSKIAFWVYKGEIPNIAKYDAY